jgi:hypothetical protein
MADKELVEKIVRNYHGQMEALKAFGKQPETTLKEYLEGIMLTEPKVYSKSDIEYGLKYGKTLKDN